MKTNTHSGLGDIQDVGNLRGCPLDASTSRGGGGEGGGGRVTVSGQIGRENNKMSGANPYQLTGRTGVGDGEEKPETRRGKNIGTGKRCEESRTKKCWQSRNALQISNEWELVGETKPRKQDHDLAVPDSSTGFS